MNGWRPLIICFACRHSGCSAADLGAKDYDVRFVKVACAGRVSPQFVMHALQRGADGVLVAGCAPSECHFSSGAYQARRHLPLLQQVLGFMGLETQRFAIVWLERAETNLFRDTVQAMAERIKLLGPNAVLREELKL